MNMIRKLYNKFQIRKLKKVSHKNIVECSKITSRNSRILCVGVNNRIILEDGVRLFNSFFDIHGNNNVIRIGKNTVFHNVYVSVAENGNSIEIGSDCCLNRGNELWLTGGTTLKIGNDCLVAACTTIRTSDIHKILNEKNEIINNPKDVVIGEHCWICKDVKILKGVELGKNCVVATGSIVSKSIPDNCLCGGVPASILKENIRWKR